jgi:transposase InsO family protein
VNPTTELSPYCRLELVRRYLRGEEKASAAARLGVSRTTFYRWLQRYRDEGEDGLWNRSKRPHSSPRWLGAEAEQLVLAERERTGDGPDRLALTLGMSRSTVFVILRRHGCNVRPKPPKAPVHRYEHSKPGAMVHVDLKHLSGITRGKRFQLSLIDDYSREAYAEILERDTTIAVTEAFERGNAFFRSNGVRIQRVLTDNGMQFTMACTPHPERWTKFQKALAKHEIKHSRTRPYSPQTNGKVERFHRTVDDELYRVVRFSSEADRALALQGYVRRYNTQRRHLGINGPTPTQRRQLFFSNQACQPCA